MTTMVRLLEREGLVARRPDPSDARAQRVFLTVRARRFEPVAARVLAELDSRIRELLGETRRDELKAALRELLD